MSGSCNGCYVEISDFDISPWSFKLFAPIMKRGAFGRLRDFKRFIADFRRALTCRNAIGSGSSPDSINLASSPMPLAQVVTAVIIRLRSSSAGSSYSVKSWGLN